MILRRVLGRRLRRRRSRQGLGHFISRPPIPASSCEACNNTSTPTIRVSDNTQCSNISRCRYYRGCWHRTCPPIAFAHTSAVRPSVTPRNCLLTREWAISAPAAVLGRGSHLSGSLSGIRPLSPVTRRRLGSPLHYQLADRPASQSALLATVSRGYPSPGADRRSTTEPFAVPSVTGMHGLASGASVHVRQNQPGVLIDPVHRGPCITPMHMCSI